MTASKFGITVERAVEMIRERGIGFTVTDAFLKQLEAQEADAAIVNVVNELGGKRKTTVQPAAAPGIIPTEPNGAEQAPPPPPDVDLLPLGTVPTAESWPQFLESVRNRVLRYAHTYRIVCNRDPVVQGVRRRGWTQRKSERVRATSIRVPHYKQIQQVSSVPRRGGIRAHMTGLFGLVPSTSSCRPVRKPWTKTPPQWSFQLARETSASHTIRTGMVPLAIGRVGWISTPHPVVRLESKSTDMTGKPVTDEERCSVTRK